MDTAVNTNEIYSTYDYNKFRKMVGNRDVEERRVRNIVKSIEKIGWISNPIIVNKKMEIIDGQGRLEALKRLGMPVEYHVVDIDSTTALNDCRVMNSNHKIWTTMDYVKSFAKSGVKDYKRVKEVMDYFGVTFDTVMAANENKVASGNFYEKIRDGQMEFSEADYIRVCARLNIHKKYNNALVQYGGNARIRNKVIFWLIRYAETHDGVDHDKIVEALETCNPMTIRPHSFDLLLESIQEAYNFGKRHNRLYFYEEWRMDTKIKGA